jgi:hypothetical protein
MFGLLPDRFLTATSYSARYARKWTLQKFALHAIKLRDLSSRSPERPRGPKEPDIKLARILHNDRASKHDILQLIAQNLDYVDLVNLSLVSKRTRSAIFPADEEWEDDRQLRFYSCYGKKKSTCWICAVQICEVRPVLTRFYYSPVTHQVGLQCSEKYQRFDSVVSHATLSNKLHQLLSGFVGREAFEFERLLMLGCPKRYFSTSSVSPFARAQALSGMCLPLKRKAPSFT